MGNVQEGDRRLEALDPYMETNLWTTAVVPFRHEEHGCVTECIFIGHPSTIFFNLLEFIFTECPPGRR